ncbi:hypothetical protein OSC52_03705 [Clostridium pasteurianum]|uniref:hypothetical protein n=1 Tax=Clostridium pasteurianum TaxID=1501 RepID=UPI002260974D|nr:hypothetical protein [Clostridium pasteurianum]UZW14960.1 hypothetical protein OSC52_03705 [Clostridium pasteurianum]
MNTLKFEIITGINEGYKYNNKSEKDLHKVEILWQNVAKNLFTKTGIYISAVISKNKTVYNVDWGCPVGGEDTYRITGIANPEFVTDLEMWKDAVLEATKILKNELKQSTINCEFSKVEFYYFK